MKELYFIVEGQTEVQFVHDLLIPHLAAQGAVGHMQAIPIRISGGGHGFNNIEHFKNTIRPVLSYRNEPWVSTLIDLYGINSGTRLPGYGECAALADAGARAACMEEKLAEAVRQVRPGYRFFIPNILLHELETLLFADPDAGFALEEAGIQAQVKAIHKQVGGRIEEINNSPETAPSRRLQQIYASERSRYEKLSDGMRIAALTGIAAMKDKSPRFSRWLDRFLAALAST